MTRFTGSSVLVRHILRRDRFRLPVWVLAIVLLVLSSALAVGDLYDTAAERASYAATVGTSGAAVAMSGPPVALDTLGGIVVFEVATVAILGTALMAVFLTLRHTRSDEEAGRTELLRAGVLGRQADLAATGLVVSGASTLVGLGVFLSFVGAGLPLEGSLLYGAAVASLGVFFTAASLVVAQIAEHGRAAAGLGVALVLGAFILRAVGDVAENGLSWLSPIGWSQAVSAFGDQRWWPLLISLGLGIALALLSGVLTTRRDLGAGLVPSRPGRPRASRFLGTPLGLAVRLQRTTILSWAAGMAVLGVAWGSLGTDVEEMFSANPELQELFVQMFGEGSVTDAYFAAILLISAIAVAGFTVSSLLRLRSEETSLRAEPLLACPLPRIRWALSWLSVTVVATAVLLLAVGLGTGAAYAIVVSDPSQVARLVGAALVHLPATLVMGGLTLALFGLVPRVAGLAWAVLAAIFVIGYLGELLSLPQWVLDASPFSRTPQVPLAELTWAPLGWLLAVAVALAAVGLAGWRRRDVATG